MTAKIYMKNDSTLFKSTAQKSTDKLFQQSVSMTLVKFSILLIILFLKIVIHLLKFHAQVIPYLNITYKDALGRNSYGRGSLSNWKFCRHLSCYPGSGSLLTSFGSGSFGSQEAITLDLSHLPFSLLNSYDTPTVDK